MCTRVGTCGNHVDIHLLPCLQPQFSPPISLPSLTAPPSASLQLQPPFPKLRCGCLAVGVGSDEAGPASKAGLRRVRLRFRGGGNGDESGGVRAQRGAWQSTAAGGCPGVHTALHQQAPGAHHWFWADSSPHCTLLLLAAAVLRVARSTSTAASHRSGHCSPPHGSPPYPTHLPRCVGRTTLPCLTSNSQCLPATALARATLSHRKPTSGVVGAAKPSQPWALSSTTSSPPAGSPPLPNPCLSPP
jgi:hypothetical protein